ncbi:MAG: hypothetical protein ABIP68_02580 [Ferruginibacter sp.]
MKNNIILFGFLMVISAGLINCTKSTQIVDVKPKLLITLKDESGNVVEGAIVRLYKSVLDTGIIKESDSTGVVIFHDLEARIYFWEAQKGCKTNGVSQTTLGRALIPNVILYGYSVMSETGKLIIANNSLESYSVSDSLFRTIIKKDSTYSSFKKIGSYLLHIAPESDSTTVIDTLIQINCSDTTFLNLPF